MMGRADICGTCHHYVLCIHAQSTISKNSKSDRERKLQCIGTPISFGVHRQQAGNNFMQQYKKKPVTL